MDPLGEEPLHGLEVRGLAEFRADVVVGLENQDPHRVHGHFCGFRVEHRGIEIRYRDHAPLRRGMKPRPIMKRAISVRYSPRSRWMLWLPGNQYILQRCQ